MEELDKLHASLCNRLYEDMPGDDFEYVAAEPWAVQSVDVAIDEIAGSLPIDPTSLCMEELVNIQRNIDDAFRALDEAAYIATDIDKGSFCEFDFENSEEGSLSAFLMETYFYEILEGITKRRARGGDRAGGTPHARVLSRLHFYI